MIRVRVTFFRLIFHAILCVYIILLQIQVCLKLSSLNPNHMKLCILVLNSVVKDREINWCLISILSLLPTVHFYFEYFILYQNLMQREIRERRKEF